jgi:O-antigen/teichoic acid export membrane protein
MSFLNNFLKIYFWQSFSIVLRFLSMFIVAPLITSKPAIYGIYMICMSFSIFLSYADFGFITAANKFVSECVARKDKDEEIRLLGFAGFILMLFVIIYALTICVFAADPSLIINKIATTNDSKIASLLFLMLALSSPITLAGRILTIIFGARLEDYIPQRIYIISSILTICSAFFFFHSPKYDIVGYYIFGQILLLFANLIIILIARNRYNYPFLKLLKLFRFSKSTFSKTRNFAFTSLYNTFCWILYYEIDLLVIARLFGADQAAYYAIALNLASFFRTITGTILFAPVATRFNQIVALNDREGLKRNYKRMVFLTMPLIVLPILSLCLLMKPFIYCWVGTGYSKSVLLAQLFVSCFILHFLASPSNIALQAFQLLKKLNIIFTLNVLLYWGGILVTYQFLGLNSFGIFKLLTFVLSGTAFTYFIMNYLKFDLLGFFKDLLPPLIIPILLTVVLGNLLQGYLPEEKNKYNLLLSLFSFGGLSTIGLLSFYLFSGYFKNEINNILVRLTYRNFKKRNVQTKSNKDSACLKTNFIIV